MKRTTLILTMAALLVMVGSVLAMQSANYQIEWFTPLTSSGGGNTSSSNYSLAFTVGQSVIGKSSSAHYETCLGYWCGAERGYSVYLPLAMQQ
jgi:hypothetical protein